MGSLTVPPAGLVHLDTNPVRYGKAHCPDGNPRVIQDASRRRETLVTIYETTACGKLKSNLQSKGRRDGVALLERCGDRTAPIFTITA